ncbi:MAG: OB-fold nucleic acid binding domain-containing protein, partial [Gemmatimonadetes bacterium]|nr:OB-fold nucleic acid binding domain-containing protein [Gemmatimonadota bacterium]
QIWRDIEVFSGYGFNKAHSAGYSMVAYQCAYLKAHYPAEFMAANLNSEIGDIERLVVLIEECRRMNLDVLPPDVNEGQVDFVAAKNEIRMGMAAIRNVGRSAVQAIVAAREDGPFESLFDFCDRVDSQAANRRCVESLIKAGAYDCVPGHRAQLFEALDRALDMAQSVQMDRARGQISMFEMEVMQTQVVNDRSLPEVEEWTERERLAHEKDMLGFYLSGHPLERYRTDLSEMGMRSVNDLTGLPDGAEVQIGGVLTEVKPHTTRDGRPMAFGTLEDLSGTVDLVVFSDNFEKLREQLLVDEMVVLQGRFSTRNGRSSVQVENVMPIEQAREQLADTVNVLLPGDLIRMERLKSLHTLCLKHPGDCQLRLHLELERDHSTIVLSRQVLVLPSDALLREIAELTGGRANAWVSTEAGRARRAARRQPGNEVSDAVFEEGLVMA